ncbi:MAG: PIN domain-containing protein [Methylococcales bacterium]|nr:PIN domain-containing protein [Methylococcales bacterium]
MKYFVDSSFIIDAYDKKNPPELAKISAILDDNESELFINRLVYLECLRAVKLTNNKNFDELKRALENFPFLDINQQIYDQAIGLSRYCLSKGIMLKGKCAALDFLHYTTARYYGLELLSNDGDMAMLAEKYAQWSGTEKQLSGQP